MIRILIITSSFPSNNTDISGVHIYEFCKTINQVPNTQVYVLTPHKFNSKLYENVGGLIVYRFPYFYPPVLQKLASGEGIPYRIKNSILARIQLPFFIIFEMLYSIKIVKKEKINLINTHWMIPQGLIGSILHKLYRIPNISTIHSSEITLIKKIPLSYIILQFIYKNSNYIVSVSRHRAIEMIKLMKGKYTNLDEKINIIPMGIKYDFKYTEKDLNNIRYRYNVKTKNVILFVGRLVEVKGCIYLLKSFKEIIDIINDITLIIIGDGPLKNELIKYTINNEINEKVIFTGIIKHEEVNHFYKISDVVVIPSIIDSYGFQEGLPVVALEAFNNSIPVIGTNTLGITEVVINNFNGIIVEQKNSDELKDAIINLLNNKVIRNTFKNNAYATSYNYRWEIICEKYMKLIEKISKGA
jgi:glycosyltransferase involved in cell wall biosynthesis